MANRRYDAAREAVDGRLFDGVTIAAGGSGLCGAPETLIEALRDSDVCGLTPIRRIYDGPTEVHKRAIVNDIERQAREGSGP